MTLRNKNKKPFGIKTFPNSTYTASECRPAPENCLEHKPEACQVLDSGKVIYTIFLLENT